MNKIEKTLFLCISLTIIAAYSVIAQVAGYTVDSVTKEKLAFVSIRNLSTNNVKVSNVYGFFSVSAQRNDTLVVSAVGYNTVKFNVNSLKNSGGIQTIYLSESSSLLNEVTVMAKKENIFNGNEPSKIRLTAKNIKEIPMLLGEKDPIKALQFLPGIQEISEGSASLSVRGGDVSQNLLLLDEAIVYNANHLFGFFSTFNADPISQLDAYKGAFPAQYGGRLSSIIDIRMRDGDKSEYHSEGGIGLISSRLLVEGPIMKDKASFLISGRRTYADWLILPFQNERERTGYYFGDLNVKTNFKLNSRNDLFVSLYTGKDSFYQKNKIPRRGSFLLNNTALNWQNTTLSARWNKVYSTKMFQNFSVIYSKYQMNFGESTTQDYLSPPRSQEFNLNSGIQDVSFKTDIDYFIGNQTQLKVGVIYTLHKFTPRNFNYRSSRGEESFANNSEIVQNAEGGAYASLKGDFNQFFYELGMRMSYFSNPQNVRVEPRAMFGYKLNSASTFSASYSRMNQYLHQISNTGNGLPTDVWIPSTPGLSPASGDIISAGVNHNFDSGFRVTLESYYKWIFGNTEYKSGVSFLGIGQGTASAPFVWENSLTQGRAWNYGYELTVQKTKGRLTGFGGYTLAWSINQFADLNDGKPFYSRQDRRHILEASLQYKLTKRLKLGGNFIFATGNPISIPQKVFFIQDRFNNYLEAFAGNNTFKAENFHRLDLSLLLESKRNSSSLEFGVYNTYFRKNPYNYDTADKIDFTSRTQKVTVTRDWLLPVVPSITYNFKF